MLDRLNNIKVLKTYKQVNKSKEGAWIIQQVHLLKIRSGILCTYPQPITARLRLSRCNKILNEADITSIKVYHK